MIIRTAVKGGIAAGTVFYFKDLGVWGSSKRTEEIYNDLTKVASPYMVQAKTKLPFEVPPLPKSGEMRYLAKHYYNRGVKATFNFIYMMPCYLGQMVKKTKDGINKAIEAPQPK